MARCVWGMVVSLAGVKKYIAHLVCSRPSLCGVALYGFLGVMCRGAMQRVGTRRSHRVACGGRWFVASVAGAVMPMVVSFTAITTAASLYTFKIVQNAQRQAAYVAKKNHIESFILAFQQQLDSDNCPMVFQDSEGTSVWTGDSFTYQLTRKSYDVIKNGNENKIVFNPNMEVHKVPYGYKDLVGAGLNLWHVKAVHYGKGAMGFDPATMPEELSSFYERPYEFGEGPNKTQYLWGVVEVALHDEDLGFSYPAYRLPVLWVFGHNNKLKTCTASAMTTSCRQMGGCGYVNDSNEFYCDLSSAFQSQVEGCLFGGYYTTQTQEDHRIAPCHAKNPITGECDCPYGYESQPVLTLRRRDDSKKHTILHSCVRCFDESGKLRSVAHPPCNWPEERGGPPPGTDTESGNAANDTENARCTKTQVDIQAQRLPTCFDDIVEQACQDWCGSGPPGFFDVKIEEQSLGLPSGSLGSCECTN